MITGFGWSGRVGAGKMADGGAEKFDPLHQFLYVGSEQYSYYDITKCFPAYDELPFSKRILLESYVRNSKCYGVVGEDFACTLDNWICKNSGGRKLAFLPAHVIWQDFTGLPAIIDLAAMRDAVCQRGVDPEIVNLKCQVDVILDSSPPIDVSSNLMPVVQSSGRDSFDQSQKKTILEASSEKVCPIHCLQIQSESVNNLVRTQQLEFDRNKERFQFLKWSATAFDNLRIVPPGSGVLHQFNLEYLANIVFNKNGFIYPDFTVGIDSHITMLNGLGVLAFGVSPMDAEAVMLGEPFEMALPEVIGCRIVNKPSIYITSTDIVLAITKSLRQAQLSGKVVEFFGSGVQQLSVLDRKTIANMCPEYGAIVGFFPVDEVTLTYLEHTGRASNQIQLIKQYLSSMKLFQNNDESSQRIQYAEILEVDLSVITSDCSGPKNPKDRVPVSRLKEDFLCCLDSQDLSRGYGRVKNILAEHPFQLNDSAEVALKHGDVLLASIASCTNSTNSSVMLAAGIMAKKAAEIGLSVKPYMKATISPGTSIVTHYLNDSHLVQYMQQLGFIVGGYGCSSCINQNCTIPESVVTAVQMGNIVAVGVLSGSRCLDSRANPELQANYLMSPLLVIAYALAGSIVIDFESDPIGIGKDGHQVFLKDVWPTCQEIIDFEQNLVVPKLYKEIDYKIKFGTNQWNKLEATNSSSLFCWSSSSTYISRPPFFDEFMNEDDVCVKDITNAAVLLYVGHNISTDFISPAGSISRNTAAGKYLLSKRLTPRELNSFGARRGCDAVMVRSTFGNLRLENKLLKAVGPKTIHFPSGDIMDVYDAAERYRKTQTPVIVLAGLNFGCGSAREWAAKGPHMLGVKAVIAESYNEAYRSGLVMFGVLPLEYLPGQNAVSLGVSGREQFSISLTFSKNISVRQTLEVKLSTGRRFEVIARLDTEREATYFRFGGILQYAAHTLLNKASA